MQAPQPQVSPRDWCETASNRLTALVVGHDRHIRSYLGTLLRGLNVAIAGEAVDVAAALLQYRRLRPHVILLGVDMAGIPPDEAMQQLRAMDPNVAVVAFSPRLDPTFEYALRGLGVFGHVPIHVVREEVSIRISAVLDGLPAWSTKPRLKVA